MIMKLVRVLALSFLGLASLHAQVRYQNDFEKAEVGSVPEEFLVIEGQFAIKEDAGNKFLELPGAPLDTFGVLFGPNLKENIAVTARIFGTGKGRRYPVFDVGLNGLGGYKLRVAPAKKELELHKGDAIKGTVPLDWQSGKWTYLKLQVIKAGEAQWRIEGKFWQEGAEEPKEPTLTFTDREEPKAGRASMSGMPYSGTPIHFDDLVLSEIAK